MGYNRQEIRLESFADVLEALNELNKKAGIRSAWPGRATERPWQGHFMDGKMPVENLDNKLWKFSTGLLTLRLWACIISIEKWDDILANFSTEACCGNQT